MGDFYKGSGSSDRRGGRSGGGARRSGGGGGGNWRGKRSFDDRGGDGPEMHDAVCSDCGVRCEVPFKPTGSKPVFCRACFSQDDSGGGRSGGDRFSKPRFEKRDRFEKSYDRPSDSSFGKDRKPAASSESYAKQFEALNSKMDMILRRLDQLNEGKAVVSAEPKQAKVLSKPVIATKSKVATKPKAVVAPKKAVKKAPGKKK